MALKIKTQTDYLVTEVTFQAPVDLNEVQQLVKETKSNAELTGMYNMGGALGVSLRQRTRVPAEVSEEVRRLIGVKDRAV